MKYLYIISKEHKKIKIRVPRSSLTYISEDARHDVIYMLHSFVCQLDIDAKTSKVSV